MAQHCPRCDELRESERPDGCRDPRCPALRRKFRKGDRIRTTYQHSEEGTIVRYAPMPSYYDPTVMLEWYIVRYDDGRRGGVHADMMNRANG